MDIDELKAENFRLTHILIDYWGEFGCCEADNGKFREKAYQLVIKELQQLGLVTLAEKLQSLEQTWTI